MLALVNISSNVVFEDQGQCNAGVAEDFLKPRILTCLHPGKAEIPVHREQVKVLSRWSGPLCPHAGENFKRFRKVNLTHLLEK